MIETETETGAKAMAKGLSAWQGPTGDELLAWAFQCPNSAEIVNTGIIAERLTVKAFSDRIIPVICPKCGQQHGVQVNRLLGRQDVPRPDGG